MGLNRWEELDREVLLDDWSLVTKSWIRFTFADGSSQEQIRQVYDRGDGAAILPYDSARGTVLLCRQFRWPAAYRGDAEPFLIETAAGLLDDAEPEARIRAEAEEELGLRLEAAEFHFSAYMSPGAVSELLHFFTARYDAESPRAEFGGLREEGEEIEVIELALSEALAMIADGRIRDAKTIILLQHAALNLMPEAAT